MAQTDFRVGDDVLWPNGVPGKVAAVDEFGDVMDECGGWHKASNVDFAPIYRDDAESASA